MGTVNSVMSSWKVAYTDTLEEYSLLLFNNYISWHRLNLIFQFQPEHLIKQNNWLSDEVFLLELPYYSMANEML